MYLYRYSGDENFVWSTRRDMLSICTALKNSWRFRKKKINNDNKIPKTPEKLVKPHSSESPENEVEQIGSFSFPHECCTHETHTRHACNLYLYVYIYIIYILYIYLLHTITCKEMLLYYIASRSSGLKIEYPLHNTIGWSLISTETL